jgi:hypothetical protein
MSTVLAPLTNGYTKQEIAEAARFACTNIPEVDQTTLERFLFFVNDGDSSESISYVELIGKMYLTLKYMPEACPYSFLILFDLLEDEALLKRDDSVKLPLSLQPMSLSFAN